MLSKKPFFIKEGVLSKTEHLVRERKLSKSIDKLKIALFRSIPMLTCSKHCVDHECLLPCGVLSCRCMCA